MAQHLWKVKKISHQISDKNHTDETRHWTQPPQLSEQYSWWCAGFCLPASPDPHWLVFPISILRWDVVNLRIHWVVQNTKQNPFLIHACCHDESWYQLKHGLQVWAIKGVFNVSSLSTREGIDGSSNVQEEMALTSLRKERVCYKRTI